MAYNCDNRDICPCTDHRQHRYSYIYGICVISYSLLLLQKLTQTGLRLGSQKVMHWDLLKPRVRVMVIEMVIPRDSLKEIPTVIHLRSD